MARSVEEVVVLLGEIRAGWVDVVDYSAAPFDFVQFLMDVDKIPGVEPGGKPFDPFAESVFGTARSDDAIPGAWHWWANPPGFGGPFLVGLDLTGEGYRVLLPLREARVKYHRFLGQVNARSFMEPNESGHYMGWTYDFMGVEAGAEDMTEAVEFVVQKPLALPSWL